MNCLGVFAEMQNHSCIMEAETAELAVHSGLDNNNYN